MFFGISGRDPYYFINKCIVKNLDRWTSGQAEEGPMKKEE